MGEVPLYGVPRFGVLVMYRGTSFMKMRLPRTLQ